MDHFATGGWLGGTNLVLIQNASLTCQNPKVMGQVGRKYGNQPGNTVMAGHNNVKGEVFRDLVNVELGDKVVVYAGESRFEYIIDFKTIVKEKGEPLEVRQRNAQWIAPTSDERLTLVTCRPYTSNTHRVIIVARPL